MSEYEVKCLETYAWFTGYVNDYRVDEHTFFVTYPNEWKDSEWVDGALIRPKAPASPSWVPNKKEALECKAKADSSAPYGWWQCILCGKQDNLYRIQYTGWETHYDMLTHDLMRPMNKAKVLSSMTIVRDICFIPAELEAWMITGGDKACQQRFQPFLIHSFYEALLGHFVLIGTQHMVQKAKNEIDDISVKHITLSMQYYNVADDEKTCVRTVSQKSFDKAQKQLAQTKATLAEYKQKNTELQNKLDLFQGKPQKLHTLNLDRLNDLEITLQSSLQKLHKARYRLLDIERLCSVCKDKRKNIAFLDGCEHVTVCGSCEKKLVVKRCPICQVSYSKTKTLHIW
eukprot:1023877_1